VSNELGGILKEADLDIIWCNILVFYWRNWGKPERNSVIV